MIRALLNMTLVLVGLLAGVLLMTVSAYSSDNPGFDQPTITGMAYAVTGVPERAGPQDHVDERQIAVYGDRVVLDIQGAQWSTFTDTNSMDPVIDQGANAIQIVPQSSADIEVGDIISYESEYSDGITIHRVIYKGTDEEGTYFIAKGDNLPTSDPGRIRFEQIKRVVVAIIY